MVVKNYWFFAASAFLWVLGFAVGFGCEELLLRGHRVWQSLMGYSKARLNATKSSQVTTKSFYFKNQKNILDWEHAIAENPRSWMAPQIRLQLEKMYFQKPPILFQAQPRAPAATREAAACEKATRAHKNRIRE